MPLWALMRHRGRSSGIEYATPIAIVPTKNRSVVLVGLPWGPRTNWARNVVAAGSAIVRWKGRELRLSDPRIVTAAEAEGLAKVPFSWALRRFPAAIAFSRP